MKKLLAILVLSLFFSNILLSKERSENEIEIVSMQNILSITGKKNQNNVQNIIHKGIALRPFEKKFNLDPLMEVNEAILSQGILNIKLFKRDPEIIQPKKIKIKTT